MDPLVIEGHQRRGTGKGPSKAIRKEQRIPANILSKAGSTPIELEAKLLAKAWAAGKTFQLKIGSTLRTVRIHELQLHPVRRVPLHMDLMDA